MTNIRSEIRFLLNKQQVSLDDVKSSDTLLDFVRLNQRLTGTKEGCAEGDCGACTVLVGRIVKGELRYETVNSCIRFLASLDSCHVVTIENLAPQGGRLHPVQQAMVDFHGSQCGFCTPGIVMSLYALWMQNPNPTHTQIETALQGNLCRCTGYKPIIEAALAAVNYGTAENDPLIGERTQVIETLTNMNDKKRVEISSNDDTLILPADVDDLARVLEEYPKATIIAGATDVGLWVTKFLKPITPAVFIDHLDELKDITRLDDVLIFGAGVSYSNAQGILNEVYPHLTDFWNRIAGWQIRNMGTIGGNIANGSPIGDTPPMLIALGAEIILRKGHKQRTLILDNFFIDYGKQDLAPGEFVEKIIIPMPSPRCKHGAYKISKRRDEDISSVCIAFNVAVEDNIITTARIALGGMAGIPKRAKAAEEFLIGKTWSKDTFMLAANSLEKDFTPLTDWRASAKYRMQVAKNLFLRFYLDNTNTHSRNKLVRVS